MSGEATPEILMTGAPAAGLRIPIVRVAGYEDLPYPAYQTPGSAGADLHCALDQPLTVRMGEVHLVPCGIRLAIPPGWEGQVRPRSGLALRAGLTLVNAPGTIDSDYRGEVKALVTCLKNEACTLERGDRIAQIVFAPVGRARFEPTAALPDSVRGTGGFGHTGVCAEA